MPIFSDRPQGRDHFVMPCELMLYNYGQLILIMTVIIEEQWMGERGLIIYAGNHIIFMLQTHNLESIMDFIWRRG